MFCFYPIWRIAAFERLLDEQAAQGNRLVKRGLLTCTFRPDEAAKGKIHRIGASGSRTGSAAEVAYCLDWQKKGWERYTSNGRLLFFRAPEGTAYPEDEGLPLLLKQSLHRREVVRNIMLILAAICMVGGYAMEGFTVVRLAAIPLVVALVLSWTVSQLQKTIAQR